MNRLLFSGIGAVALLASGFALAQMPPKMDHSAHGAPAAKDTPSTTAFKAANARMHKDMAITFTGNPDVDFVKGMLPHHQGAVDMARIVLAQGKDPEVRKLAEDVIKAQEAEIAWMKTWLSKHGN